MACLAVGLGTLLNGPGSMGDSAGEGLRAGFQGAPPLLPTVVAQASSPRPRSSGESGEAAAGVTGPQAETTALKREAVEVAGRVAAAYPEDPLGLALLGSAYFNTGRSSEAERYLGRCLELNPEEAEAYGILARIAYEKGQLEEAVRLGRESLKRAPGNPEILNRLARALMDLGRSAEAAQVLEEALRVPQPRSESFYLLGQVHLQAGEAARAKASFLRAIEGVPDHTQAYFGLFTACQRLGQTEEAARYREQFQKFEAIDRRSLTDRSAREDTLTGLPLVRETVARTLFGAAQIYRKHREPTPALALLQRVVRLDDGNPAYRAALESLYVQTKALSEGVGAFEQLVKEQPDNALNYYHLGRLQGRLRQVEGAERAFRKVQALAPRWAEGYRALAELNLRHDRHPEETRALAARTVELEPSGASYHLLGAACVQNNDRAGALAALKRAVALSPGEARYREFLEQLEKTP